MAISRLIEYLNIRKGITVSIPTNSITLREQGLMGYYIPEFKTIVVDGTLPSQLLLRTLIHETVHVLLRHGCGRDPWKRGLMELEVGRVTMAIQYETPTGSTRLDRAVWIIKHILEGDFILKYRRRQILARR